MSDYSALQGVCLDFKRQRKALKLTAKELPKQVGLSNRELNILNDAQLLSNRIDEAKGKKKEQLKWAKCLIKYCRVLGLDYGAVLRCCKLDKYESEALEALPFNSEGEVNGNQDLSIDVALYGAKNLNVGDHDLSFYKVLINRLLKNINAQYNVSPKMFDSYGEFSRAMLDNHVSLGVGPFELCNRLIRNLSFYPIPLFRIRLACITTNPDPEANYAQFLGSMLLPNTNATYLTIQHEAGAEFLRCSCGLPQDAVLQFDDGDSVIAKFREFHDKPNVYIVCDEFIGFNLRVQLCEELKDSMIVRDLLEPDELQRVDPVLAAPSFAPCIVVPSVQRDFRNTRPWLVYLRQSMNELFANATPHMASIYADVLESRVNEIHGPSEDGKYSLEDLVGGRALPTFATIHRGETAEFRIPEAFFRYLRHELLVRLKRKFGDDAVQIANKIVVE